MAIWIASHMRGLAVERTRHLRSSAVLSIVSFKRTFAESGSWERAMLQTGWYKLRNRFSLYFDTLDAQDTCALAGDTNEWPSRIPD
jgi:hypothetical protein